jgi:hypothetical protein
MLKYKDHCIFKQGIEKKLCFLHLKTYLAHIETHVTLQKSNLQKLFALKKHYFQPTFPI